MSGQRRRDAEPPTYEELKKRSLLEFERHRREAGISETKSSLESTVGVWVRDTLFPKKKFIVNMREMKFGGKICKLAFKTFLVPKGTQEEWWDVFSKKIKRMLNQKRANVSSDLKNVVLANWKKEMQQNQEQDGDTELDSDGFGNTDWKDVMELRKNKNLAYDKFCNVLLPSVVGRLKWKRYAHKKLLRQFVTPTDEALCLLLLENNWNRWKDIASGKKEELASTKFTAEGKGSQALEFKGWSDAGYERFNELCRKVIADRDSSEGEEFEKAYLKLKRDAAEGKQKTNRMEGTRIGSTVEILDDLDDSELQDEDADEMEEKDAEDDEEETVRNIEDDGSMNDDDLSG